MFFYEAFSIFDFLILMFSVVLFITIIYKKPKFLIISILFINLFLSLASFFIIELGGYITELGQYSYRTNNFFIFFIYIMFFVLNLVMLSHFFSNYFFRINNNYQINLHSYLNYIVGMSLLILIFIEYLSLAIYGVPILQGENKVDVAINNLVVSTFGSTGTYVAVFFGAIYFTTKNKIFLILFLLHFLFCVLAAQKFSALINNFGFFLSPYLLTMGSLRISRKLIINMCIFFCTILSIFYLAYDVENAFSRELGISTWLAMGYRALFLSAHAQWFVLDSFFSNGLQTLYIDNLLEFHKFIVEQLHPADTSNSLDKGVTFGMIYPTYLFYSISIYFHPFAIFVLSALIAFIFELYAWSIKTRKVVLACVVSVLLNIFIRVIITGNFSLLFSTTTIFVLIIISLYILITNINRSYYEK